MRLDALEIAAYGSLSGVAFDFGKAPKSVHLIYGPNEAGKTTIKSAIEDMLFRIGGQSKYGFLHGNANLSIRGTLSTGDGRTLTIERRKKNKEDLRDRDGQPLPESVLAPFLAGLQRGAFLSQFSLSCDDMRKGSQAIVDGEGELGNSLYSAALGNVTFLKIVQDLDREIAELFKPTGHKRLNVAIAKYTTAKATLREATIKPATWEADIKKRDEAQEFLEKINLGLRESDVNIGLLERLGATATAYHRCADLRTALEQRKYEIILPKEVLTECHELSKQTKELRVKIEQLNLDAAELEGQAVVPRDAALREEATKIAGLHATISRYRDGQRDLEKNRIREYATRWADEALQHLARVWPGLDVETARTRVPATEDRTRANELVVEYGTRSGAITTAKEAIARLEIVIGEKDDEVRGLPPPTDVVALRAAITTASSAGPLDKQISTAQAAANRKRAVAQTNLDALGLFPGNVAALQHAALPSQLVIAGAKRALDGCDTEIEIEKKYITDARRLEKTAAESLAALRKQGEFLSEAELAELRSTRDGLFVKLQEQWQAQTDVESLDATAIQYVPAMQKADQLADDLRSYADRVAETKHTLEERDGAEQAIAEHESTLKALTEKRECIEQEWAGLWAAHGIVPHPPDEMSAWLQNVDAVRKLAEEADEAVAVAAHTIEQRTTVCGTVKTAMTALALSVPFDDGTLEPLLAMASDKLSHLEKIEQQREELVRDCDHVGKELERQRVDLEVALSKKAAWEMAWSATMESLWLSPSLAPSAYADTLREIDLFHEKSLKAKGDRQRVDGIEREGRDFTHDVVKFVSRVERGLVETAGSHPDIVVEQLNERVAKAHAAHATEEARVKQLAGLRHQCELSVDILRSVEDALAGIAREHGVEPDRLLDVVMRSEEIIAIRARLEELRRSVEDGTRITLEECDAAYAGRDQTAIGGALSDARLRHGDLVTERDVAKARLDTVRALLRDMDTSEVALEADAELLAVGAEVDVDARRWAELTLAREVLNQQVREYLEKHKGPLLTRSREYFRELTGGAYIDLHVVDDEIERPELEAIDHEKREILINNLSEGTRDALYLALRLASLEEYIKDNTPQPLILDDAFVQLDDERTCLAFRALAEFSKNTQVIYFTHHARCLEAAEKAVPADQLMIHTLASRWDLALPVATN